MTKIILKDLSDAKLVAYDATKQRVQQINAAFWGFEPFARMSSYELKLIGERKMAIDQWAVRMGEVCRRWAHRSVVLYSRS